MIRESLGERISEVLPSNSTITFEQAIEAVQVVFDRRLPTTIAQAQVAMRRHVNLLAALRQQNVLAVAGKDDNWTVELPGVSVSE